MQLRVFSLGLLILGLSGCRADRITTAPPQVTVESDAWSGGTLLIISSSFQAPGSLPLVTVGAESLLVRSAGPDSFAVQVPDTDGWVTIGVHDRTGGAAEASVHVHGVAGWSDGPTLDGLGEIAPWPGNGNPSALAVQNGRLVLIDYRLHTVSAPLTSDTGLGRGDCAGGPLPSVTVPGLIAVQHDAYPLSSIAVPIEPAASPPDTGPATCYGPIVHLSRGRWLAVRKPDGLLLFTGSPSSGFTQSGTYPAYGGVGNFGFAVSPRGDRVLPTSVFTPSGTPVIDVASGGLAYYLTSLYYTGVAAYTPGGDTLFVTGTDSLGHLDLLSVNAATGGALARVDLDSTYGSGYPQAGVPAVGADPTGPWLYVAGSPHVGCDSGNPVLEVRDRASLALVATLRIPRSMLSTINPARLTSCSPWNLVMSPVGRRVYMVLGWSSSVAGPTLVISVDLKP
jgi:hypothetical protein